MDNDTILEVLKYLNYCQLASNSLVSKSFHDLIQIHRYKLALLYVNYIGMGDHGNEPGAIKIFNEQLSSKEYNEWAICNKYSKQIPIEGHGVGMQSTQYELNINASAYYKDPNQCISVFSASAKLNNESWPVFQHFVRLLSDPFINICNLGLIPQEHVLNLLSIAANPSRIRFQCEQLTFNFEGNIQLLINWIKDHVLCKNVQIYDHSNSNYDKELLDLFWTGGHCTSKIRTSYYCFSNVVNLVQKFMDLKICNEYKMVQYIQSLTSDKDDLMKHYVEFIVKDNVNRYDTAHYLEFDNSDIGKKLKLRITNYLYFSLTIDNL